MLHSILIGIILLYSITVQAFVVSGQAFQYGEGTDWDFAKINISPMSTNESDAKGALFGIKQAEWWRNCTSANCYLDLLLPLPELAEIPWAQENTPALGRLVWSGSEAKLRGSFHKENVLPMHWAQHRLGKELAITFAAPDGLPIGKSVKIKTLSNVEMIVWEIDFSLLLKLLTEFRPVP